MKKIKNSVMLQAESLFKELSNRAMTKKEIAEFLLVQTNNLSYILSLVEIHFNTTISVSRVKQTKGAGRCINIYYIDPGINKDEFNDLTQKVFHYIKRNQRFSVIELKDRFCLHNITAELLLYRIQEVFKVEIIKVSYLQVML